MKRIDLLFQKLFNLGDDRFFVSPWHIYTYISEFSFQKSLYVHG